MKRPSLILVAGLSLLISPAIAIIDTNENGISDLYEYQYNNDELFPPTFDPRPTPTATAGPTLTKPPPEPIPSTPSRPKVSFNPKSSTPPKSSAKKTAR